MPMTISIVGAKGGTAKSSTAHALAHVFAAAGLDVVLVDADPQGSLTRRLGLERATNPLATDPLAILPVDGGAGIASQITLFPGGGRSKPPMRTASPPISAGRRGSGRTSSSSTPRPPSVRSCAPPCPDPI